MTSHTSPFDHDKIRNAVWTSGLTLNEVAFRAHLPAKALTHIVDGKPGPLDIRLDTLKRLATHLGLPLHALFAAPPQPPAPTTSDGNAVSDATTVIATIYDRGTTPTIRHDLALALGWDTTRLNAALDEAEHRLAPAGLTLNRTHGECSVVPIHDHTEDRAALTQAQSDRNGTAIAIDAYEAVHQVMTGQPLLPQKKQFRRQVVLGNAANLGILDLQPRTPRLTDAALEAFPACA